MWVSMTVKGKELLHKGRTASLDVDFAELHRSCQLETVVTVEVVVAVVGAPGQLDGSPPQLPYDGHTQTYP